MRADPSTRLQQAILSTLGTARGPVPAARIALACDVCVSVARRAAHHLTGLGHASVHPVGKRGLAFGITPQGRATLPTTPAPNSPHTPSPRQPASTGHAHRSTYRGEELRPFTGRAGAMDAFALPSRGIGA